jgi:hypothetical protein
VHERLARHAVEAERDVVGEVVVVHDDVDPTSFELGMEPAIRVGRVHVGARPRVPPVVAERARAGDLRRRQQREGDALLHQDAQDCVVDCGLGQPHAFGGPPEAVGEVGQSPAHLGADIALVRERQDRVVVRDGDGGAGGAVRVDHALVDVGVVTFQPREQRRAHVEGQVPVVVDDRGDEAALVHHARPAVRPVALGRDALVPVVPRRRGRLRADFLRPGVLARRLVEVPVHYERRFPHPTIVAHAECRRVIRRGAA